VTGGGGLPSRDAAFRLLGGHDRDRVLDPLSEVDSALATEIAQGVMRFRGRLDLELKEYVHLASLPASVRSILRIGAYQLRFLERVPDFAAVDETVLLARRRGLNAGLVNAVLRKVAAGSPPRLPESGRELLCTNLSLPGWLADRWIKHYGRDRAEEYARASIEKPPLHLAVHTRRISSDDLVERLGREGVRTSTTPHDALLRVEEGRPLAVESFEDGLFYVMGPASFAVAEIASTCRRDPVLDGCASPGGKLIRMWLAGADRIAGMDTTLDKVATIHQNLDRMRITGPRLAVGDVAAAPPFRLRSFAAVLIDAPCSGLGVIAKLPEIKWRLRESDIHRLARQQLRLLHSARGLLLPDGTLVYSVCSLEPEEGEMVVGRFLHEHRDLEVTPPHVGWARADEDGFFRFFPRPGMQDGFFVAVMRRRQRRS